MKFRYIWWSRWYWLVHSEKENGMFNKLCVGFGKHEGGVITISWRLWFKKKNEDWKHATETFNKHMKLMYHLKCIADTDNF